MNLIKYSTIALVLVFLNSCAISIPVNQNFYSNDKKLGIIVHIEDIALTQMGSRGLLDLALTPGNRFKEPLDSIAPNFDFREKVKSEMNSIMNRRGKKFEFLPDDINIKTLYQFEAPKKSKLKYSKLDYRPLKEQYDVDEILIMHVKYGLAVGYYGMIETGKDGFAVIDAEIINLENNALLGRERFESFGKMKGNWKKDNYSNLINAIHTAMNISVTMIKSRI